MLKTRLIFLRKTQDCSCFVGGDSVTSEEKKKFLAIKTYEEFNQRRCSTDLATVEERDKLANEEMRQKGN